MLTGELMQWHKVTLTFDGPASSESANPNPFLDYRMTVTFTGPSGQELVVPGYFAADGNAANTGAISGNQWRAHLAPDEVGLWSYAVEFVSGDDIAVSEEAGTPVSFDGASGSFNVMASDKTGRDFRAHGRLALPPGSRYPRFLGSGEYFLKQGPDAPENFLAYQHFDGPFKTDGQYHTNTFSSEAESIKNWNAHLGDWQPGDPLWAQVDGVSGVYGKGMIGAVNYLASEGMNAFSFITFNIKGDDKNVFMYTNYSERERFNVSKIDQWEIIFEHADRLGMFLHFKTQETENNNELDGGALGKHRKLYYRELIARFSHHLAMNWNLGEENTQTTQQRKDMAQYFHNHDPYGHLIVLHTYPHQKDAVYTPLLGNASQLTGVSLQTNQTNFSNVHGDVKNWVANSANAGKPWAVAVDEPGDAVHALRPDNDAGNSQIDGRKNALWGALLAGAWGNEWYFGYDHAHSDLTCQDFRSRDQWWDTCRYALEFFELAEVPFWEMQNNNALSSASNDYCFYLDGNVYVVYLKNGGSTNLDLTGRSGRYQVRWYDPRNGGALQTGSVEQVDGGTSVSLGQAPSATGSDWVILVERDNAISASFIATPTLGDAPLSVQFDATSAAPGDGATITSYAWDFEDDGVVDATGATVSHIYQDSGTHSARLTVTDSLGQTDSQTRIIHASAQAPYGNNGLPHPIPGRIEGENYDLGGQGVAYSDLDPENQGGKYREEGVDINTTQDVDGDFNLGWLGDGEWLEYTVNVTATGLYNIDLRVARSNTDSSSIIVLLGDGAQFVELGEVNVPNTNGWQTWQTVSLSDVALAAGQHVLRLEMRGAGKNMNWIEFLRTGQSYASLMAAYPQVTGSDALPEADADQDGISNLLELYLNTHPDDPASRILPSIASSDGNFHIKFKLNPDILDGECYLESSTNLHDWTRHNLPMNSVSISGNLIEIDTSMSLLSTEASFLRLQVTTP